MKKLKRFICVGDPDEFKKEVYNSPKIEMKGIVRYDPEREGLKSSRTCCVIEVDEGVTDFYRSLVVKKYGILLHKPSWKSHISIIQGGISRDDELFKKYWKKYEGMEVTFKYHPFPRFTGDTLSKKNGEDGLFWFLDVECEIFNTLRKELGLIDYPHAHLTIGRNWC